MSKTSKPRSSHIKVYPNGMIVNFGGGKQSSYEENESYRNFSSGIEEGRLVVHKSQTKRPKPKPGE
jgi:hypothetical protein